MSNKLESKIMKKFILLSLCMAICSLALGCGGAGGGGGSDEKGKAAVEAARQKLGKDKEKK
jgi:hypothetical protein